MTEVRLGDWVVTSGRESEYAGGVILANQQHTGVIVPAEAAGSARIADGIVLAAGQEGRAGVYTSDCLPLVLAGEQEVIVLHISRKSLVAGILDSANRLTSVRDLTGVYLGPHICEQHFVFEEMGESLRQTYERYPEAFKRIEGVWYMSLERAVADWLRAGGYSGGVIRDERCTFECLDLPSYRRGEMGKAEDKTRLVTAVGGCRLI